MSSSQFVVFSFQFSVFSSQFSVFSLVQNNLNIVFLATRKLKGNLNDPDTKL
jgi:hypothetical protein